MPAELPHSPTGVRELCVEVRVQIPAFPRTRSVTVGQPLTLSGPRIPVYKNRDGTRIPSSGRRQGQTARVQGLVDGEGCVRHPRREQCPLSVL